MHSGPLTLNDFGRHWYFKHLSSWGPGRSRAVRLLCLRYIMPELGIQPLTSLMASHIEAWLCGIVEREAAVTDHLAADTLLKLLEAVAKQGHLSGVEFDQLRRLLEYRAVKELCEWQRGRLSRGS